MKSLWQRRVNRAFTLVEMLVVIAIIAILAALLLPALTRGKQRAQRIQCIGNLKEIGTAFQIFAHDHAGRFPMQTPQAEGGSEEYVTAGNNIPGPFYFGYRHLQTLANELVVPRILVCPADRDREPAPSFGTLQNSNISYFVGVYANYNYGSSVLAGDRNVTNNSSTASLVQGGFGLRWTSELHFFKGNVLFSDAHVEQMNNANFKTASGSEFVLPTVKPPFTSAGPSGPDGPSSGTPTGSTPTSTTPTGSTPTGNTPSGGLPSGGAPGGGAPGGRSPGSGSPGAGSAPGHSQFPSPPGTAANAASNAPGQEPWNPVPAPMGNGSSGSQNGLNRGSNGIAFLERNARETNGNAAISNAEPAAAAPAASDDDEPPLLWLLGAGRTVVAKSSWWLWLLLALLIAAAAYLFSRKKKRPVRRR